MKNISHHRDHCINAGNDLLDKLVTNLLEMKANAKGDDKVLEKINYVINRWNDFVSHFHLKELLKKNYEIK